MVFLAWNSVEVGLVMVKFRSVIRLKKMLLEINFIEEMRITCGKKTCLKHCSAISFPENIFNPLDTIPMAV